MFSNCGAREDSWEYLDIREIKPVNPKGNQPWIFIVRTDAEAPIHWPLDVGANSLEKSLMLGKIEGRRRWGWQRTRWLDVITYSTDMNLGKLWEMVKDRDAWSAAVHQVTKSWTGLSNWTIIYITHKNCICWKTKMHIMLLGILIEFCVMSTNLIWHSNDIAKKNK